MRRSLLFCLFLFIGTSACDSGGGAPPSKNDLIISSVEVGESKRVQDFCLIPLKVTVANLRKNDGIFKLPNKPIKIYISATIYNPDPTVNIALASIQFLSAIDPNNPLKTVPNGMMFENVPAPECSKEVVATGIASVPHNLDSNSSIVELIKVKIGFKVDVMDVIKESNEDNNSFEVFTEINW